LTIEILEFIVATKIPSMYTAHRNKNLIITECWSQTKCE